MTDLNSGSSPNIIRDRNIGAIVAVFLNGVVNGVNDHVQSARRMDKTGILQNMDAAESKINQGSDMAIDMINAYFKKNGIGINL